MSTHLEDLLVLLSVGMLHLLSGRDVVLEVTTCVLPCLQTLMEKLGDLGRVLVRNGIVVGRVGGRSGRQGAFCGGHICGCVFGREMCFFAMGESAKTSRRGAFDKTERRRLASALDGGTRGK